MATWRARIEFDAAADDERAGAMASQPAGTVSYDRAGGQVALVFDVQAATLDRAVTLALRTAQAAHAAAGVPSQPLAAHVTAVASSPADQRQPPVPELIGPAEVATILGVPKGRLRQVTQRADFPPPVARARGGAIYARPMVEVFNAGWDRSFGPSSTRHAQIAAELARIPQGRPNTLQQRLRLLYNRERGYDLRENPDSRPSDTLFRLVDIIRARHPDFDPAYDRSFFPPHPSPARPALRLVPATG